MFAPPRAYDASLILTFYFELVLVSVQGAGLEFVNGRYEEAGRAEPGEADSFHAVEMDPDGNVEQQLLIRRIEQNERFIWVIAGSDLFLAFYFT